MTVAAQRIRDVLEQEYAVLRREVEARLAEYYFESSSDRFNIYPHITTAALRQLTDSGEVVAEEGATRGSSVIPTIHFSETKGRATNINRAAARKRLLYARFRSWSQASSRYPRGQIGPAGEAALRAAVIRSQQVNPFFADAGEVAEQFGYRFDGPLDSGGFVLSPGPTAMPVPVAVLIEMKNLRTWLYAKDPEVWQVLRKAQRLQLHDPSLNVFPVLVCRRAHAQVRWMGQQLGFMVIETKANFIGTVDERDAREVRTELQFIDLKVGAEPSKAMIKTFAATIPRWAAHYASTWRTRCHDPSFADPMAVLASSRDDAERDDAMEELLEASEALDLPGWRLNDYRPSRDDQDDVDEDDIDEDVPG
ncbi:hypothetical protein SAMN04488543_2827 [Friedmanniella luteola]|uniref:Uncharacterized protein n=1 Tax=Friedmanniella luteola TaxID=546871 RepID=A0A1H1WVG4_9ACTN|nr:hypothetical protein [Friedmanniella luteola]SDT00681.1 hypothetical protein SAMN04488543_2827 [Friedmanniella luteola]